VTRTGDVLRAGLRGLGELMITIGVVLLLFTFYELQVTGLVTAREQGRLSDNLASSWAEPLPSKGQSTGAPAAAAAAVEPAPVALGDGFAVLRVPRLGDDFNDSPPVVVEGVGVEDLKKGPGHIPGTALPGEVGNVVLSGHRTTYGQPFNAFDELRPGDAVVLETRDTWFTYRVTGSEIVSPDAVEVTYPVPRDLSATPTKRLLTMTTCHPKYSAKQRLIVSGELESATPKSAGRPASLQEL